MSKFDISQKKVSDLQKKYEVKTNERELKNFLKSFAFLVLALIWPLTLYRSSQFAPDERTCIKQHRAMEKGAEVSFKKRFDCFFISEFPILIWIDRPVKVSYPRNEDGTRYVKKKPPREGMPTITLNKFVSQKIEEKVDFKKLYKSKSNQ